MKRAGALTHRIQFLRRQVVTDDYGGEVETWSEVSSVWAEKEDLSDAERVRAMQVGASVTTRFRVRETSLTACLNAKDRVKCDSRIYEISGIKDAQDDRVLELTCVRLADG